MLALASWQVLLGMACVPLIGFVIVSLGRRWAVQARAHRVAVVLALLGVFLLLAMVQLDGLLKAMHEPDSPAGGMQTVSGLTSWGSPPGDAQNTIRDWRQWHETRLEELVASPDTVVRWSVGMDMAFLVFYGLALVVFLEAGRSLNESIQVLLEDEPPDDMTQEQLEDALETLESQERLAGKAVLGVGLLAALDVLENVLSLDVVGSGLEGFPAGDVAIRVLHSVTLAKWAATGAVLGLALPMTIGLLTTFRGAIPGLRSTLARLRALLVVTVVFGAIVLAPIQVADVIRHWDARRGILAVAFAGLLGVVSYAFGRRLVTAVRGEREVRTRHLFSGGGILVALGTFSLWLDGGAPGLLVPGMGLVALGVLNAIAPSPRPDVPPDAGAGAGALPRLLAVAPIVLIGVAALSARFADTLYLHPNEPGPAWLALLLWGFGAPLLAAAAYLRLEELEALGGSSWSPRVSRTALAGALLLVGLIIWQVARNVWPISQRLGAVALAGAFLSLVAAVGGAATLWIEETRPPRSLSAFGLARIPLGVFLILWLVFADVVPVGKEFHDVTRTGTAISEGIGMTHGEAFRRWRGAQVREGDRSGRTRAIPMVFVATSGGGIKSAVWTAFVLDCVLHGGPAVEDPNSMSASACRAANPGGENRTGSVFAASGISGGSLGLVEYVVHELATGGEPEPGWIRRVMAHDFVSPNLAWQLFVESPRAFLRFDTDMDRAEVLQRAWERAWKPGEDGWTDLVRRDDRYRSPLGNGFLTEQAAHGDLPLLLLNGTTVEGGCRFVTSLIETTGERSARECSNLRDFQLPVGNAAVLGQGAIGSISLDLVDFLCPGPNGEIHDVSWSAAALLSARFPYVSPTGRVPFCGGPPASVHVVDGGYLDGSGGMAVKELWDALANDVELWNANTEDTCLVPYLLQIDAGYESPTVTGGDSVSEPRAPLRGNRAARDSRSVEGRNAAALAFHGTLEGVARRDRYAILNLRAHPGSQAPLGWTLSADSVDELEAQLGLNADQLGEIRSWFEPGGCT